MKGIVHMLEAVLVSLTFMMIVPFLLYPFIFPSDWDRAQMSINGQDLLASLDKASEGSGSFLQNIMQKNSTELDTSISNMFRWLQNRKMNYGIKTVGAIPNEIRVGFNCTPASCMSGSEEEELEHLESVLRPAYVNGRYVSFYVFPFTYESIGRQDMDVLLIRGNDQRDEANNRLADINDFLSKGRSIVGFYDVSPPWQPLKSIDGNVFGLAHGAFSDCNGKYSFFNTNNASRPNYAIQKYFYGVGINQNFTYKWEENNETEIVLWESNYLVRRVDSDDDGDYDYLDFDTNGDGSYDMIGQTEGDSLTIGSGGNSHELIVEKIDTEWRFFTMNFDKDSNYNFEVLESQNIRPLKPNFIEKEYVVMCSDGTAAVVVNGSDSTLWRSVWISDESGGDDVNALLKSSIIWASGREWWNVARSVSRENQKTSYFVSQGEEFIEPFWTELNLWYVY